MLESPWKADFFTSISSIRCEFPFSFRSRSRGRGMCFIEGRNAFGRVGSTTSAWADYGIRKGVFCYCRSWSQTRRCEGRTRMPPHFSKAWRTAKGEKWLKITATMSINHAHFPSSTAMIPLGEPEIGSAPGCFSCTELQRRCSNFCFSDHKFSFLDHHVGILIKLLSSSSSTTLLLPGLNLFFFFFFASKNVCEKPFFFLFLAKC